MIRSRASVPIAENISAYFTTLSEVRRAAGMFRYLQKYGGVSTQGGLSGLPRPLKDADPTRPSSTRPKRNTKSCADPVASSQSRISSCGHGSLAPAVLIDPLEAK